MAANKGNELREALRLAIRQNSHDMLLTNDEIRLCEAALAEASIEQEQRDAWMDERLRARNAALGAGYHGGDLAEIIADLNRRVLDTIPAAQIIPEGVAVEPVAWVEVVDSENGPYNFHGMEKLPEGKHHLYAAPVESIEQDARVWVPLTDEDRQRAYDKHWGYFDFGKAIEAMCREKNAALLALQDKP